MHVGKPEIRQGITQHHPRGDLDQRHAYGLADERHRPAGAEVGLQHVQAGAIVHKLDIQEALHLQRAGQPDRDHHDGRGDALGEVLRGEEGDAVTGVHARPLHVLHDPRDQHGCPIRDRVDFDLQPFDVPVDQHRMRGVARERIRDEHPHPLRGIGDLHALSAQHVGGPHDDRQPDPVQQRLTGR